MDLSLLIDLDIDNKARKALQRLSMFIGARSKEDKLENIEKAIEHLRAIKKELEDTIKMGL